MLADLAERNTFMHIWVILIASTEFSLSLLFLIKEQKPQPVRYPPRSSIHWSIVGSK